MVESMLCFSVMALPPLPRIVLERESVRRSEEDSAQAFLHVERSVLRARFEDGEPSKPFTYDIVARERLDAVVIAAHFVDEAGRRLVYLRSALRPPVAFRPREAWPMPERDDLGGLWELPAGLVETDERSPEGLRRSAARELHEELGFDVDPDKLTPLGPSSFPAPGIIGERHFYFHVLVDPSRRVQPSEDGSVLEQNATIVALPLDEVLDLVRSGMIEDAKTELGLRRLSEMNGR
jgi:ADP-ribose pyrophosphatase